MRAPYGKKGWKAIAAITGTAIVLVIFIYMFTLISPKKMFSEEQQTSSILTHHPLVLPGEIKGQDEEEIQVEVYSDHARCRSLFLKTILAINDSGIMSEAHPWTDNQEAVSQGEKNSIGKEVDGIIIRGKGRRMLASSFH